MHPPQAPRSGSLRRIAFLVALTVDALGTGLFLPFSLLFFVEVHGLGIGQTGLLAGIASVIALVALPPCGALLDRIGPRAFTIANFGLRAAAFVGYVAIDHVVLLGAAFAVVAVGDRSWPPASQLYVAALVEPERRTVWLGISRSCRMAGMGAGTLVAGLVATVWEREGLLALAVGNAATFAFAALLLLGVPVTSVGGGTKETFLGQVRSPAFRACLAALGPSTVVYVAVLTVLPVFVVETMGGPAWLAAAIVTVNTVTTVVGQVPLLALTRRWDDRRSLVIGSAVIGCGYALLAAVPALGRPPTTIAIGLLAALVISIGADLFYPSSVSYLSDIAPAGAQGRWLAAYQMEFALANGIGAAMLTSLLDVAAHLLWPLLAVMMAVAVIVQSRFLPMPRSAEAPIGATA